MCNIFWLLFRTLNKNNENFKSIYDDMLLICNKVWNSYEIKSFKLYVLVNLALVEIHSSPLFFDVMTYLLHHLVNELDFHGLVAIRWITSRNFVLCNQGNND